MPVTAPAKPAVTLYAEAVLAGRIVAGRLVRLACERHLRDLADGHKRGLCFDAEAADKAIRFYPAVLRLADGVFAGQPFVLQPSQEFIIGSLFGWKRTDGARRFKTAYIEEGKGNGKTPLLAGAGIYLLVADGEEGAEVYSAAVTREQAGILFRDAKRMIEASPGLSARLDVGVGNIAYPALGGFMRPVSREAKSLDGKRVHGALIDELHEHLNADAVDKMRKGAKARRQPLLLEITNAGYNQQSVCWEHHEYSQKVLERVFDDDEWFAYVCGLDPCEECRAGGACFPSESCPDCDDWRDERVWLKANPLLGVTIQSEYLRREVREAAEMPSKRSLTKRLNFCIWTEAKTSWIAPDVWARGNEAVDVEALLGRACYGGIDLSSSYDMTAFALLFPPEERGGRWRLLVRYWIPEANLFERVHRDHVPYDAWRDSGLVETTPGNVIDYDWIEAAVLEEVERFRIVMLGYDRYRFGEIYQHLSVKGVNLVPVGQGFESMDAPCKELERLVAAGLIVHGGNRVLAWNVANAELLQNAAGNVKIAKADPKRRIDGLSAVLTALYCGLRGAPAQQPDWEFGAV